MKLRLTTNLRPALLFAVALGAGCQRLDTIITTYRNSDLEFHYTAEGAGVPERASVSSHTCVIAQARRLDARTTADPALAEIEIEETQFPACKPDVIYRGRVVFRCRRGEEFCTAVGVTPMSGSRPRDVFSRWPASTGPRPISR